MDNKYSLLDKIDGALHWCGEVILASVLGKNTKTPETFIEEAYQRRQQKSRLNELVSSQQNRDYYNRSGI